MKTSLINRLSALFAAFTLFVLNPIGLLAQDGAKDINVDLDIDKGGGGGAFYTQPWVWIVGGAVFILLLVALMRGRGGRNSDV